MSLTFQHRIVKTTIDGEVVWEKSVPKESGGYESADQYIPTNIAIAPNGDFYVGDGYGQNFVHHYNARGEYVRSWGGTGDGPEQFKQPHGIWVDTRGETPELVVADRGNMRIVYYTLDGERLREYKFPLGTPCHFDQRGDYLVIPELWGKVKILDRDNNVYTQLGFYEGAPNLADYPNIAPELRVSGKFSSPHECIWDQHGNLFCVEWIGDGRVTKLRRLG